MAKKILRVTKLGMGTKRAQPVATTPPPSFSCPSPRVPRFETIVGEAGPPPQSFGPSGMPGSGIRRSIKGPVPRVLADGPDLASLPLVPRDVFVLSRIDGRLTVEELADLLEMTRTDLDVVLVRLVDFRLVTLE